MALQNLFFKAMDRMHNNIVMGEMTINLQNEVMEISKSIEKIDRKMEIMRNELREFKDRQDSNKNKYPI